MNRTLILAMAAASLGALAVFGSIQSANASAPNSYVLLQASSPGSVQPGNTNIAGKGIYGAGLFVTNTGVNTAIRGITAGDQGTGGVYGTATAANSNGVIGICDAGASAFGVYGSSASGYGVVGQGLLFGVSGQSMDAGSKGVSGISFATGSMGVDGYAVLYGVRGINTGNSGAGVRGEGPILGGSFISTTTSGTGVEGSGGFTAGFFHTTTSDGTGVSGYCDTGANAWGVSGESATGIGVVANGFSKGVSGVANGNSSSAGVYGQSTTGAGVAGYHIGTSGASTSAGVYGKSTALAGNGVAGEVTGTGNPYAVWGIAPVGKYAFYGSGNGYVSGSFSKASGTFKIDHPQDPENKWLYHSFVESPDMMNVYNGNVTTDADGIAEVALPTYFEDLNKDFRYQLTVIGQFAQAIVSRRVSGNSFEIRTDKPNVDVSWQVTGIRKDNWANAHRVVPEVDKTPEERGKYQNPEVFGQPESKSIDYDRMRRLASQRTEVSMNPLPKPISSEGVNLPRPPAPKPLTKTIGARHTR